MADAAVPIREVPSTPASAVHPIESVNPEEDGSYRIRTPRVGSAVGGIRRRFSDGFPVKRRMVGKQNSSQLENNALAESNSAVPSQTVAEFSLQIGMEEFEEPESDFVKELGSHSE